MSTPVGARRRQRPVWVPVVMVLAGVGVLFAAGFGVATLLQGNVTSAADPAFVVEEDAEPLGECVATTIIPAEVLPSKDEVVLNVYNSTKRAGLAGKTAREFKAEGFRIKNVANDPRERRIPEVAEIRFGPNAAQAAQLVEYYLAGAKMVELKRKGTVVDVSLGRGYTTLANGAAVAAALATPQQILEGPGCTTSTPVESEEVSLTEVTP
jgi:hypothetical protein